MDSLGGAETVRQAGGRPADAGEPIGSSSVPSGLPVTNRRLGTSRLPVGASVSKRRPRLAVLVALLVTSVAASAAFSGRAASAAAVPGEVLLQVPGDAAAGGVQADGAPTGDTIPPPPPYDEGVVAEIELTNEAEARGDRILLGEVATVRAPSLELTAWLSNLPVANAPLSEEERRLTGAIMLPTLRRLAPGVHFQLDDASTTRTVTVGRASQQLSGERIAAAVDAAVAESLAGRAGSGLRITYYNLPEEVDVPLGDVRLDVQNVERLDRSRPGPSSVTVNVVVDGERVRTLWLRGWVEPNGASGGGGAVGYGPPAVGATWSAATAGAGDVEYGPLVIERGDTVEIVAVVGELRVSTVGVAQRDGRVGEQIAVRNPTSGKVITGRVIAEGTVRVDIALGS